MRKFLKWTAVAGTLVLGMSGVTQAGVSPNALENAYWRYEEGSNGASVPPGTENAVPDSANANHLRSFDAGTSPTYTSTVAPSPLRSGLPNTLALSFTANVGGAGGDDLYTVDKNINNGIIADGGGYTLETAFRLNQVGGAVQTLVVKEGQPAGAGTVLPTLALNVRGDTGELEIEQFDGNGVLQNVRSLNALSANQWYYAAVVNDGSNLSLYLDSNDGNGYLLQGTDAVTGGALYQGTADDWNYFWSVGRGQASNAPANWVNGIMDETRLSNTALAPSNFLFVPEPGSVLALAAAGLLAVGRRRRA